MLRKQTYLLSVLLVLVLAAFIGALVLQSRNREEASLRFLSAYGAVNYVEGESRTLNFCFMTKGDWNFFGDPSFNFESPYVTTTDVKVTKESTDGDYSFWDVECGIALLGATLEEEGVIPLVSVGLAGTPYRDVIDLRLVVFPADVRKGAPLAIVSKGNGTDGKGWVNIIQNVSNEALTLCALEFPAYEKSKITLREMIPGDVERSFTGGEKVGFDSETVAFLPGKCVELEGDLSSYEVGDGKKCYFVDPVLHYQLAGEDRVYPLAGYETYPSPVGREQKALWESLDNVY